MSSACRSLPANHQFFWLPNRCGDRNFLNLLGVLYGLPTLPMIVLRQNRVVHILIATLWLALSAALFMRAPNVPRAFARNLVMR